MAYAVAPKTINPAATIQLFLFDTLTSPGCGSIGKVSCGEYAGCKMGAAMVLSSKLSHLLLPDFMRIQSLGYSRVKFFDSISPAAFRFGESQLPVARDG